MSDNLIQNELHRREARARQLADRYPDLGAHAEYGDFLLASEDAGLELDFVTSSMLFEELQRRRTR